MMYTLPELGYGFADLEPHIDAMTMEIHYTKHHQAYLDKFNSYLDGHDMGEMNLHEIVSSIDEKSPAVFRNNAGGYYNHMLFWQNLSPEKTELSGSLLEAVQKAFGSEKKCLSAIVEEGMGRFGSGWVWLVSDDQGVVSIMTTPNQDNPVMSKLYGEGLNPLVGIDLWEHAYYLHYQNRRKDYLEALEHIINWDEALKRYES